MFYAIAREGKPSKYEVMRLRNFELQGRRQNIILEAFDLGTDIAFMLVMFDQSGAITLPGIWDLYKAQSNSNCPSAPPIAPSQIVTVLQLAIASAVFIGISSLFRFGAAIMQIYKGRNDIKDGASWVHVTVGAVISIVDPWNGALWINEAMVTRRIEGTDFELAWNEFKADLMLLALENIPQLVIQIIYGVTTGQTEHTTVAFFVAIFATCYHIASQAHEIVYLGFQLSKLKQTYPEQLKEELAAQPGNDA